MSYEIIYDKQFIDLEDGNYLPFVLTGSNNTYDYNNRRARSWWNWTYFCKNNEPYNTLEGFLEKCDRELANVINRHPDRPVDEIKSNWGPYTSLNCNKRFTYGNYEGIFKTGVKNAVTIEELNRIVNTSVYVCNEYLFKEELDLLKKYDKKEREEKVNNPEEFYHKLEELKRYYSLDEKRIGIRARLNALDNESIAVKIRRHKRGNFKIITVKKSYDKYFTINVSGRYFVKLTRCGYRYSYSDFYVKKFTSRKKAEQMIDKIKRKSSDFKCKIIEHDSPINITRRKAIKY